MAPSLFISYAHADMLYKDQLVRHFAALKNSGVIREWNDRYIQPGEKWDHSISEAMQKSDVIVFLVSSDFLASDYINRYEITTAMEREKSGQVRIIPVVIRPCDFYSSPLSQYQALPRGAKPISTWNNMDEAYLDVVIQLKELLNPSTPSPTFSPPPPSKESSAGKRNSESLRALIGANKVEVALKEMLSVFSQADPDLHQQLLMISGRWNELKKNQRLGLIDFKEFSREQNQINAALLEMISEWEKL